MTGLLVACIGSETDSDSTDSKSLGSDSLKEARVVRVIDGDTLDVLINGTKHRVRLFGIDTPERGEKCYREATSRMRELSGDVVNIESGPRTEDRYGRLLFYLYTQDGESIDARLIQEGLATAWTRDGQHRNLLVAEEHKAKETGTGCLW